MGKDTEHRHDVSLEEAAEMLGVSTDALLSLRDAGFIRPVAGTAAAPRFRRADLKAFVARNAEAGSGNLFLDEPDAIDPQDLLDALDGKSDEMAKRAFDLFSAVFPEATGWSLTEQHRFVAQARARFEAILAVTGQGAEVDEALVGDLQDVGAEAAWAGSPLPQLLVVLRISRDLVVQTAVELAEERGQHWGLALSLLLTRILPAIDRLTDSLAQGYWAAILGREEDAKARYQSVVESSTDGIYEVDLDGSILYCNPSLALILGRRVDQLDARDLGDVLVPLEPGISISSLMPVTGEAPPVTFTVARPDGVRRVLEVRATARRVDGELLGFQGVVHDVTTARDLEADKNEFLAMVTYDLRNPLTTVLGLGATIESHADELDASQVARMGASIRLQAERMSRLADDLYDVSRLEARSLIVTLRPVDLATTVASSLHSVPGGHGSDVDVEIEPGITVLADPRRLEQVVANLVDNGLHHGKAPVVVRAARQNDQTVVLSVADSGPGVPASLTPTLFSGLRTLGRRTRDRSRGTGLGLALARGLAEAMGGTVWYEPVEEGGARFCVSLALHRNRP